MKTILLHSLLSNYAAQLARAIETIESKYTELDQPALRLHTYFFCQNQPECFDTNHWSTSYDDLIGLYDLQQQISNLIDQLEKTLDNTSE